MKNQYSNTWYSLFMNSIPIEKTQEEIEFIKTLIPVTRYKLILDLCCGTGRLAKGLSEYGYEILGIDSNDSAIKTAKNSSHKNLKFQQKDIFNLSLEPSSIDAIICMWQSFGYGNSIQNVELVKTLWNTLKEDGLFLLDIYNKDFFNNSLGERSFDVSGVRVTESKEISNDRLSVTLTYNNSIERDIFNWQIFSPLEISQYMRTYSFELVEAYSSFSTKNVPSSNNPRAQYLFRKINKNEK